MRKKLLGLVFAGALLVSAVLPGTVLAGHNATSQDTNDVVCHKGRTINVNNHAFAAHLAHGDAPTDCDNVP